ncbi:MAG: hypothetical protein ACLFVQ_11860 [Chitinispirillaceae bacterium]
MKKKQKTEDVLGALLLLEKDALGAYERCIASIQDQRLRSALEEVRQIHSRNMEVLEDLLSGFDIELGQLSHMRGFFPNARGSLERMDRDNGIMESVLTGEKMVGHTYRTAFEKEMAEWARMKVEEIYGEQKRGVELLRAALMGKRRS